MNNYYVYIYWRLDINEPFYVGKGKGKRWKRLDKGARKNKHFRNIINKIPIAVEIIKDNLTEEQAHGIEIWLINELVFEYGFSIDIEGNRSNDHYCHLTNKVWGGEGCSGYKHSEEWKIENSKRLKGVKRSDETKKKISEANKGKNPRDYWIEGSLESASEKMSERMSGKNNPNYGKSRSDETKEKISKTIKNKWKDEEYRKSKTGKNNPNYGKHLSEEEKRKLGKSVICLTTKRIFFTATEGAIFYNINYRSITNCCNGYHSIVNGKKYRYKHGGKLPDGTPLVWRYLKWNHNKIYRIKKIKER